MARIFVGLAQSSDGRTVGFYNRGDGGVIFDLVESKKAELNDSVWPLYGGGESDRVVVATDLVANLCSGTEMGNRIFAGG